MRVPLILTRNSPEPDTATAPALSMRESDTRARKHFGQLLALLVQLIISATGLFLIGCAVGANRQWLDHHILPSFLLPRDWFVGIQNAVRVAMGAAGALLIAHVTPRAGRVVRAAPEFSLSVVMAAGLAMVASEPLLRRMEFRPAGWLSVDDEPRRRADASLGWSLVPSRAAHVRISGRTIDYLVDANGYRVSRPDAPVDRTQPTVLFTGESVMFGEGLAWNESVPARVGARLGVQTANLAVHGFGSDQAFLRLRDDLPHFRQPLAVVSLFMPELFGRNLDRERPHLGPGLVWRPAVQRWRVASLLRLMVPYRSASLIDQGVALTREIFAGTRTLAQSHQAIPLIVVPQFGAATGPEQDLLRRIFSDLDVPVTFVQLDPTWRLPWNRHPDVRAAEAIADAVTRRLRGISKL